jgi:AraC family transcriptional regulator
MTAPPARPSTLAFHKARMLCVLRAIQERLDESLGLETLAALAALSPYHFHRVFRGMLGEPLAAHVRRIRLERAAHRLRHHRCRVVEVAFEAGYDSHEAFSRAFRAAYGETPSRFRRCRERPLHLPAPSGVHYHPEAEVRDFRTLNQSNTMNVTIEDFPPTKVACARHLGPYERCGEAWDRICQWMGKEGYLGPGCRFLGVSYDDPETTPPEQIRYDACVTVEADFSPPAGGGLEVRTVGGGLYARATHFGPYANFNQTYSALMGQWIPRHGYVLREAPCLELYLNSPDDTPEAELLTDVFVPVQPANA